MPVLTGAAEYPENALDKLQEAGVHVVIVQAAKAAQQLGNVKAQNIVLLGALVKQLELTDIDWSSIIKNSFPEKLVDLNLKAFEAGLNM